MSYRSKLFALLLLAALVPGFVAIGLDYTTTLQTNKTILDQSRENTLEGAEHGLHLVLDGLLKTIELSTSLLETSVAAHAESLGRALTPDADVEHEARQLLRRHRLAEPSHILWHGVYLPDQSAMLIRSLPSGSSQGGDEPSNPILRMETAAGMDWLADVRQCRSPCWSGEALDPITKKRIVAAAMVVGLPEDSREQQPPVVVMAYDFSPLYGMFRNGSLPRGTEAFLVDTVHAHTAEGMPVRAFASPYGAAPNTLDTTDAADFGRMLDDLRAENRGVVRMEHRGRPSFWAYGTIPGRPLALVLISPLSPYLETLVRTQTTIDSVFKEQIRFMWYVLAAVAMLLLFLSSLFSRMITGPLQDLAAAMRRIAEGDYTARVQEQSAENDRGKDEIGSMRRTFNAMAANLEEHAQTKEDLNVARLIQRRLLPDTPPSLDGWDIAGESLYSKETGGDIYDYILTPPRRDGRERITLSVGDATGHGIQAALLMTTARAMLRALLSQGAPLAAAVSDLNWLLTRDTYGTGRFLSLFAVEIAASDPVLHWVRCGHEPALLYFSDRDAVTHLRGTGAILGVDSSIRYQAEQTTLRPGSILLLATDGVWETTDPDGEMYGHTRLEEMIRKHASLSAERIVAAILDDLRTFRGKDSPEDDSTIIVAKYQA